MLRTLTKGFRVRAAILLIAVYSLCVMAPHVALALSNGAMAVHCLNVPNETPMAHDHAGMAHSHMDGMTHSHHDDGIVPQQTNDNGKAHSGNCCGVFCMVILANASGVDVAHHVVGSPEFATPVVSLVGDEPDLPYRPPNV